MATKLAVDRRPTVAAGPDRTATASPASGKADEKLAAPSKLKTSLSNPEDLKLKTAPAPAKPAASSGQKPETKAAISFDLDDDPEDRKGGDSDGAGKESKDRADDPERKSALLQEEVPEAIPANWDEERQKALLEDTAPVQIPRFSKQLEQALDEVVPSEDPLDRADFDPIAYINEIFPSENSLGGWRRRAPAASAAASLSETKAKAAMDSKDGKGKHPAAPVPGLDAEEKEFDKLMSLNERLSVLRRRVIGLSETITRDVREHSSQRSSTKKAVEAATLSIQELFAKIKAIKEKAAQSEVMVNEICRDIKKLDYAKKHLTNTIRAMRNVHMLVSIVTSLDDSVVNKHYKEAAKQLKAANDLFGLFEAYKDVAKIKQLQSQVDKTKDIVRDLIIKDFKSAFPAPSEGSIPALTDACAVVDSLGPQVKKEIVEWFTEVELIPYRQLFAITVDAGAIDQAERRYAWHYRVLKEYDTTWGAIFPQAWDVPAVISYEFCRITREHFTKLLEANRNKLDVPMLLRILQKTIEFEKSLVLRFKSTSSVAIGQIYDEDDSNTAIAEAIKLKHQRQKEEAKAKAAGKTVDSKHVSQISFNRLISEVFTPYMAGFVELEHNQLSDLIKKIGAEEKWNGDAESKSTRLVGSDELFLYIKKSMKGVAKLSKDHLFFSIFKEYKYGLTAYADLMDAKIPKRGISENQMLLASEISATCLLINTAEYCCETIPSLEETLQKTIDEQFRENITMSSCVERFQELMSKAVTNVANSVINRLTKVLTVSMAKVQWGTMESVGDQSDWVNSINSIVMEDVGVFANMVSARMLGIFMSTLGKLFAARYMDAIYKCRRINEMGAQQLALDTHAVKTILTSAPTAQLGEEKKALCKMPLKLPIKMINTEMAKSEALLKTLVSPTERLIVTFKALMPNAKPDDLVKVMGLRGLERKEMKQLIEEYNRTVSDKEKISLDILKEQGSAISRIFKN